MHRRLVSNYSFRLVSYENPKSDWHKLVVDMLSGQAEVWYVDLVQQRVNLPDPNPFKSWEEFELAIRKYHTKGNPAGKSALSCISIFLFQLKIEIVMPRISLMIPN